MLSVVRTLIFLISILYPLKVFGAFSHGGIYIDSDIRLNPQGVGEIRYTQDILFIGNSTGILPTFEEARNFFEQFNIPPHKRIFIFNGDWVYTGYERRNENESLITRGWFPRDNKLHQKALNWYLEHDERYFHKDIGFCE